jgi:hypothetical protein
MRILDIDLDFFLDHRPLYTPRARPPRTASAPWSAARVRAFLEERCGLDARTPLPGRTLTHHHEVFLDWRKRINRGALVPPFEVVHVDWHADLGMGEPAQHYIMTQLLHAPPDQRSRPSEQPGKRLGPGNYLAFAIACRWISGLVYVYNPRRRDIDVPAYVMQDFDLWSRRIQLKQYPPGTPFDSIQDRSIAPSALEPDLPFRLVGGDDLTVDAPFDWIYLTQSPDYTPPESDRLIPLIEEYMRPPSQARPEASC